MTPAWPQPGRCGACARPAQAFPSGRWEHLGKPCRLRSQTLFGAYDVNARDLLVFVPDGDDLPQPQGWRQLVRYAGAPNLPSHIEMQSPGQQQSKWDRLRAELAADAERDAS